MYLTRLVKAFSSRKVMLRPLQLIKQLRAIHFTQCEQIPLKNKYLKVRVEIMVFKLHNPPFKRTVDLWFYNTRDFTIKVSMSKMRMTCKSKEHPQGLLTKAASYRKIRTRMQLLSNQEDCIIPKIENLLEQTVKVTSTDTARSIKPITLETLRRGLT